MRKIGEQIDQLTTIEMGYQFGSESVLAKLYESARKTAGDAPLSLYTADRLMRALGARDVVIITTGFMCPPLMGENDGPPGAAVLARALSLAFDVTPVLVTEQQIVDVLFAACRGAGMNVYDLELSKRAKRTVAIEAFPMDKQKAKERSETLVSDLNPSAIISVERPGRNEKGEYHYLSGSNITPVVAKVDYLFEEALSRGILTIGIGDGGNELGLGKIKETVKQYVPTGKKCKCPCEGGIAADIAADIPVIAGISNWGCYGLAAALSAITGMHDVLHTGAIERRILGKCADAGAVNGHTWATETAVDGISEDIHVYMVEMLRTIVEKGRVEKKPGESVRKSV